MNISQQTNIKYDIATHDDFHIFSFKDKSYIYDINNMNIFEIDENTYDLLIEEKPSSIAEMLLELSDDSLTRAEYKPPVISEPLSNISLNVAQVCNLSCVYCYAVDGEYGLKGKMTLEVAKKSIDFLIDESRSLKKISITFFGGEPLLNFPVLKESVNYAKYKAFEAGKKISFSITTNGTKFEKEVNDFLNFNNFSVTVSFDGDKETQDKNRPFRGGKGSFESTLPKIKGFLDSRNGEATARATVTNYTTDLKHLTSELRNYGFKRANATVATVSDFAKEERGVKSISIEDKTMLLILESEDLEAKKILDAARGNGDISEFYGTKIFNFLAQLKNKKKRTSFCGAGRKMVGISINGDVYPCHRFVGEEKFKLGNISDFKTEKRKKYSESYTFNHPTCQKCWAKFHCGGAGCIQDNEVTMGDVNTINIRHCTQLKHQLKHAIDIYSNLTDQELRVLFP